MEETEDLMPVAETLLSQFTKELIRKMDKLDGMEGDMDEACRQLGRQAEAIRQL